jgi:hypothetical protein
MSGYGPSPDPAAEPDARAGYQRVVTRVREGLAGIPFHGGVERDVSTKVIVVVATDVELAAAPAVEVATKGRTMAESRRPEATAPSGAIRRIAPITPSPERNAIVS